MFQLSLFWFFSALGWRLFIVRRPRRPNRARGRRTWIGRPAVTCRTQSVPVLGCLSIRLASQNNGANRIGAKDGVEISVMESVVRQHINTNMTGVAAGLLARRLFQPRIR